MTLTLTLVAAAISLGSVHTLAPDHWVPFAALARAQHWSARRTALVTAACGLGHVTVSVALGVLGVLFGLELLQTFGNRLESVSGLLLIGFGAAYGLWGMHRTINGHRHVHAHGSHLHYHNAHVHHHQDCCVDRPGSRTGRDHDSPERPLTAWTLFLLFSADPCVAVIPLMFASAPLGWPATVVVAAAYEAATIATMIGLVLPARAAAGAVRGAWADRWGDALAGGVVAAVGLAVIGLGI